MQDRKLIETYKIQVKIITLELVFKKLTAP